MSHDSMCPVAEAGGSCCPWMGECDCQCMCDLILTVIQRTHTREAKKRVAAMEDGIREGIKQGRARTVSEMRMQIKEAWRDGRASGIDAAREAVEQVSSLLHPLGPALAAIDALREEQK